MAAGAFLAAGPRARAHTALPQPPACALSLIGDPEGRSADPRLTGTPRDHPQTELTDQGARTGRSVSLPQAASRAPVLPLWSHLLLNRDSRPLAWAFLSSASGPLAGGRPPLLCLPPACFLPLSPHVLTLRFLHSGKDFPKLQFFSRENVPTLGCRRGWSATLIFAWSLPPPGLFSAAPFILESSFFPRVTPAGCPSPEQSSALPLLLWTVWRGYAA